MLKKTMPNTSWLGRKDRFMSLTRQQREAQEADEFLKGLSTEGATPGEATPPTEGTVAADPVPATPPSPAEPDPGLRAEIARLQAALADENSPTYRHRFEVLQGKYNAEIPRMNERIRDLEAQLASKKSDPPVVEQAPEYEEAYNDLVDEHGPSTAKNLITIAKSIAQEIAAKNTEHLEAQLAEKLKPYGEQVAQLAQGQQATAEERFFASLDAISPGWKQINGWGPERVPQDPKFTAFLDTTVPGTDFTYDDLLIDHYRRGNPQKVKEIFDIFKGANPAAATPPATPAKGVEQYIDPGTTGRGTTPPDNQPKTYTQAQVDAFFDSRVKGTFRGTREEATRLENEYTKAIYEGRVR